MELISNQTIILHDYGSKIRSWYHTVSAEVIVTLNDILSFNRYL